MKKLNKIVAFIGIMVIMTIVLTGCELKLGNDNKPAIDKAELTGYTEYTHSSGVKFSYPEEWKSLGTATKPVFADSETGTNVNFLSESVATVNNLSVYVTASIANIKTQLGDKIEGDIAQEEVKLNGRDAIIISYDMTQNNVKIKIKQACFLDNKTAYILTTATTQDGQDSNIVDNIISSFMK